jgi:hypothetical protein
MTHVTGAQRFLRGVRRIEAAGRPARYLLHAWGIELCNPTFQSCG